VAHSHLSGLKDLDEILELSHDIKSPYELCWHKKFTDGPSATYLPCRVVSSCDHELDIVMRGDSDDDLDDYDELKIEYLSRRPDFTRNDYGSRLRSRTVPRMRLVPFYGNDSKTKDIGKRRWCANILNSYKNRLQSGSSTGDNSSDKNTFFTHSSAKRKELAQDEIIFLGKLLNAVLQKYIQNAPVNFFCGSQGYDSSDDSNLHSCESDSSLEEPYTQANGLPTNSDEEMEHFFSMRNKSVQSPSKHQKRKKEPIHPGDVIEYFSPIYVHGDERGRRTATIVSVDPDRNPVLSLDNDEHLSNDTEVKRIGVFVSNNLHKHDEIKGQVVPHAGLCRPIGEFKLKRNKGFKKEISSKSESKRVGKIIERARKNFDERVKQSSFAPLDMMYNYGNQKKTDKLLSSRREQRKHIQSNQDCKELDSKKFIQNNTQSSSSNMHKETKKIHEIHDENSSDSSSESIIRIGKVAKDKKLKQKKENKNLKSTVVFHTKESSLLEKDFMVSIKNKHLQSPCESSSCDYQFSPLPFSRSHSEKIVIDLSDSEFAHFDDTPTIGSKTSSNLSTSNSVSDSSISGLNKFNEHQMKRTNHNLKKDDFSMKNNGEKMHQHVTNQKYFSSLKKEGRKFEKTNYDLTKKVRPNLDHSSSSSSSYSSSSESSHSIRREISKCRKKQKPHADSSSETSAGIKLNSEEKCVLQKGLGFKMYRQEYYEKDASSF